MTIRSGILRNTYSFGGWPGPNLTAASYRESNQLILSCLKDNIEKEKSI
jgi:hypothetical protein